MQIPTFINSADITTELQFNAMSIKAKMLAPKAHGQSWLRLNTENIELFGWWMHSAAPGVAFSN
jgi:hypothetical protein